MKIIKYSAEWCGPCKTLSKVLESMKLQVEERDIKDYTEDVVKLGIKAVPTLIFYKDNKEVKRLIGSTGAKEIQQVINSIK